MIADRQVMWLIVDTDSMLEQQLTRKLADEGLAQHMVEHIWPDSSLSLRDLVDSAVSRADEWLRAKVDTTQVVVLIDLVLRVGDLEWSGSDIARALRRRWPSVTMYIVTAHMQGPSEADLVSAATLEDVDGVLATSFLCGDRSSARRLLRVATKPARNIGTTRQESLGARAEKARARLGAEAMPESLQRDVRELGEMDFWLLIDAVLPGVEGVIARMAGGRSGAAVFRAHGRAVGGQEKQWIVKVDRDLTRLAAQARRYDDMLLRSNIARDMYVPPARPPVRQGSLGALCFEFEADTSTFSEFVAAQAGLADLDTACSKLAVALRSLYTEPREVVAYPWKKYFAPVSPLKDDVARFLASCAKAEQGRVPVPVSVARRLADFIESAGETEPTVCQLSGPVELRTIHGDLNAGNLLVRREDCSVVLIDLAPEQELPSSMDLAKLERDALLRCGATDEDVAAWSSDQWGELMAGYTRASFFDVSTWSSQCAALARQLAAARAIRRLAPLVLRQPSIDTYRMSLIAYLLKATVNEELGFSVRSVAVRIAERLLDV